MLFKYDAKCIGKYDVVVAGGGPAGFAAAMAAAREGLSVLLVDAAGCLGGVSTTGALPFLLGATTGSIPFPQMIKKGLKYSELPHPRKAVGGIFDLVISEIKKAGGGVGPAIMAQTDKYPGLDRLGCHDEFTFDLETGKRVLDELAIKYGVSVLYYTRAIRANIEDNKVKGIWLSSKNAITYAECSAIIDCTGDADIVYEAGYPTYKGDKKTGEMTNVGLIVHIENIDSAKIEKYLNDGNDPWFTPACAAARAENPDKDIPNSLIIFPMMQDGVFMVNGGMNRMGIDGSDAASLTEMTFWGRQRAKNLVEEVFRKHIPGAENCRLRLSAAHPGVRETRRIVAEYSLTENDLVNGTIFPDIIALAGRHFDLERKNDPVEKDGATKAEALTQTFAANNRVKLGVTAIPYRALIPLGSDDIIVAGRCIAAEGQALGPARIMSTCMATGEAAGIATYLKLKNNIPYREVDTEQLRDILRKNGAEVDI